MLVFLKALPVPVLCRLPLYLPPARALRVHQLRCVASTKEVCIQQAKFVPQCFQEKGGLFKSAKSFRKKEDYLLLDAQPAARNRPPRPGEDWCSRAQPQQPGSASVNKFSRLGRAHWLLAVCWPVRDQLVQTTIFQIHHSRCPDAVACMRAPPLYAFASHRASAAWELWSCWVATIFHSFFITAI